MLEPPAPGGLATVDAAGELTVIVKTPELTRVTSCSLFMSASRIPPGSPVTPDIVTKAPVSQPCEAIVKVTTLEPITVLMQSSVPGEAKVVRMGVMLKKYPPSRCRPDGLCQQQAGYRCRRLSSSIAADIRQERYWGVTFDQPPNFCGNPEKNRILSPSHQPPSPE
jgi:hypothetical protein